ncbi:putative aminohydrolase SsnA [Austwickia sp. TVS 96-490-7B]|uniref:putative aminohydrolase SsnA n=1 Tax=Austwickia sp. TVS 96-490-7B TaxID=2830843 RepID=UPI001C59CDA6|nr:putative aminohydrolase SsnA [Austwickia sp. TVS 96-490-7B]MBW3086998.1 putative aminohydrolase SsnA [Austwickia sp. TVS 96-490-7B]
MIIGNGPVITQNPQQPFLEHGAVRIDADTIIDVGPDQQMRAAHPEEEYVDVAGRVIMPGLINAHNHAYSHYARGMAPSEQGRDFVDVLEKMWWKLDRLLTLDDVEINTMTTFIEGIRNGVTTQFDHHSSPHAVTGSLHTQADVCRRLGVRASLCYETSDRDGADIFAASVAENVDFMRAVNGPDQDLIKGLFGLHAAFTLSQQSLETCAAAATDVPGGFHVHTAEGPGDEPHSHRQHGRSIVERFHDTGILGPTSLAVHCVHIDDHEWEILQATDTPAVHNPMSNMGNAIGAAPITHALNRGALIGLGTDAYTQDMLISASVAKILQSHHLGDPTVGFGEALTVLTNNAHIAARHFRRPLGILTAGAYADIITVDYQPHTPMNSTNTGGHLLFGMTGRQVTDTMVAGRWIMRDRIIQTVDEAAWCARSRENAPRIWARM